MHGHEGDQRLGDEGPLAGQELVEEHAQGVDVRACVHGIARDLLRRDVVRCAADEPRLGDRAARPAPALQELGDPEVQHGHPVWVAVLGLDEDVVRLEIAVDDPHRVRLRERVAHLGEDVHGALRRHGPLVVDDLREAAPGEALHDQVELPRLGLPAVIDRDRVGVTEHAGGARLPQKALDSLRVLAELAPEDLDGHLAVHGLMPRQVDGPHAPLSQHVGDGVLAVDDRAEEARLSHLDEPLPVVRAEDGVLWELSPALGAQHRHAVVGAWSRCIGCGHGRWVPRTQGGDG